MSAVDNAPEIGTRDPERLCDHICLLDEGHVERGERHFYGYEIPSPRTKTPEGGPMTEPTMPVPVEHLRAIQKWRGCSLPVSRTDERDHYAALDFITAMDLPEPEWEPSDEMVARAEGIGRCTGSHTRTLLHDLHARGINLTLRPGSDV